MFYVVDQSPSGKLVERYRTDFHYDDSVGKSDAERCPKCGAFIGMLEPVPPYVVRLETWGTGFGDVAFWMDDFLVTRRFVDAYKSSGLCGLSDFEQVTVRSCRKHRKIAEPIPDYWRTMPTRGAARIDPVASRIDWGEPHGPRCDVCLSGPGVLKRWKGVVVDESSWNGDDIFYAYGIPGALIVSSRFAEWVNTHEFKNFIFEPAESSAHDFYPMESTTTR
jgi:hypothetical protein